MKDCELGGGVIQTLRQACVPRPSVFEQRGMDTVYDLDSLGSIDAQRFFAENFVTDGMKQLLTEAFNRLEGRSESAAGTFLLSQSMGGGKTHNLIALGLLASNPSLRQGVMGSFFSPGPLGKVRVVTFTGRNPHTPFGIWGHVAEQLNKKDALKDFYQPLQPPGAEQWIDLLRGDPLLILFDELPPYFEAAMGKSVGETTLAHLTTTALANLLVAVNGSKLPNVCVVMTDLRGAAYSGGSQAMNRALEDLEKEANRVVVRIDPVRMNAYELYSILATRIFEQLPDEAGIRETADAYFKELDEARLMDITAASPDEYRANIVRTYPFHPAIRDLFGRFKENSGFQQTRALIRIMRLVVAQLWESGAADAQHLIGAQDFDLHSPEIMSEIRQINGAFDAAIAHDIAAEGESSVAEQLDGPSGHNAQDASKLILLSSLSEAVNPTLGLDRSEIAAYMAAPGRDLEQLRAAIDAVQQKAWYVHPTAAGRLIFRNVENLIAKLETYTHGQMREQREDELRKRLRELFKPLTGDCYQDVEVLPALDRVTLSQDRVTLLVFRPAEQSLVDIRAYHEQQQYKNRVVFLTGTSATYETALQRAAELYAIRKIVGEMTHDGLRTDAPQLIEARELESKKQAQFYQACRETFQALYYPSKNGLTHVELEPKYDANDYKGEEQIRKALAEAYKFTDEVDADSTFRNSVENKLWPGGSKEVPWSSIKQRAACEQSWLLHHPRALEDLKTALVSRDLWREHDGYVERGPFDKPSARVQVQEIARDEEGLAVLRVTPLHGDRVYFSTSGPATSASELLDTTRPLETRALRVSFLVVDSVGEHATGDPYDWQNRITVKHRFFQDDDTMRCELKAFPEGALVYTADGSNPAVSGSTYEAPFEVPAGARIVLAIAEAEGIRSPELRVDVPAGGEVEVVVDSARPAIWTPATKLSLDDTNALYAWFELASRFSVKVGGVHLVLEREQQWIELNTSPGLPVKLAEIRALTDELREHLADGRFNATFGDLHFESGKDLMDMVAEMKTRLQPGDVEQ